MRGGAAVRMGGQPLLSREVNEQVLHDTEHAELVSLPLTEIRQAHEGWLPAYMDAVE